MNPKIFTYCDGGQMEDSVLLQKISKREVGIFETLRTYNGTLFKTAEHTDRFFESAKSSMASVPFSRKMFANELRRAFKLYQKTTGETDGTLRPTFVSGRLFIFIAPRKLPKSLYCEGVALKTSAVKRSHSNAGYPELKTAAYQNSVMACLEDKQEAFDWLFLDAQGYVAEVSIGNIFAVVPKGSRRGRVMLQTPPTEGILNGLTRQYVIECALQAGVEVAEKPTTRHDLYNAREAFLTNTTWEILPIKELDGRSIGLKLPGTLTCQLQRLFQKKIKQEIKRT